MPYLHFDETEIIATHKHEKSVRINAVLKYNFWHLYLSILIVVL